MELNLNQFQAVSLEDTKSVILMSRIDKKFVFNAKLLNPLLNDLKNFYHILEINGKCIQLYETLYYDTVNRFFFLQHHNRRVNRNKVRFRKYVDSGLVFLEIKFKNNKGKTIKNRMRVDKIPEILSNVEKKYIKENIGKNLCLVPQHRINFNRITLIDKLYSERVTIDLHLTFFNDVNSGNFDNIIIAEIKKNRSSNASVFQRIAKKHGILPIRLSKYCMSTIDLWPNIKSNRFKEKRILIDKIKRI